MVSTHTFFTQTNLLTMKSRMGIVFFVFLSFCMIIFLFEQSTRNPPRQIYSAYYRQIEPVPYLEGDLYTQLEPDLAREVNNTTPSPQYLIIGNKVCPSKRLDLAIIVISSLNDRESRDTIRKTWGSYAGNKTGISLGFLLGGTRNSSLIKSITLEASETNDLIVDTSFIDTYLNLTRKSQSMIKWAATYCPHASSLLKTDSDMWINVPKMLTVALTARPGLHGDLYKKAPPIHDPKSKWFVSKREFPEKYYPNYLSGTAYLLVNHGTNLYEKLYKASLITRFLNMEDVWLTGLVATIAQVPRYANYNFKHIRVPFTVCTYRKILSSHEIENVEKFIYWDLLNDSKNDDCHT